MTGSAATPVPARRPSFGIAVLVVAFIFLAPPLFLLAPLALLLLFSRPRTAREWLWLVLSAAAAGKIIADFGTAPLPARVMMAGGVMMTGAFLLLVILWRNGSTLGRALVAAAAGMIGVFGWSGSTGVDLGGIDAMVIDDLNRALQAWLAGGPTDQVTAAMASAPAVARIFPGLVALQGLAGVGLAWVWYHRIAERPLGPEPRPFAEFRFVDHLIWGAIFTLALVLTTLGDPIDRIVECVLVVWIGIYALRGAAVVSKAAVRWPMLGKILLVVLSFLALPIAIGTTVALGVADTWLDFRNRAGPNGGGSDADGSDSS